MAPEAEPLTVLDLLHGDNNEAYRRLVDTISDYAIFFLAPDGVIASWNIGAERIKGYRADEVIGKHFSIFYTCEALALDWPSEELRRAAAQGHLEDEGWRLRKDGSRFWANVVITALRGRNGELLGFSKVTRDLTHRREQEQRTRDSERALRLLVESVVDYAIYSMDETGVITSWNVGAQRIKGYSADEAIGKHFSMFYPPEDIEGGAPQAGLDRAAQAGHFESEGWRVRKDGTRLWAAVTIAAIRDEQARLVGFSKVTRDLTERRRHDMQLREREENLRLLVEGVKDHAMYLLDGAGRVRTWNAGAQKVFGFSSYQALRRDVALLYVEDERATGRPNSELAAARAAGLLRVEGWRRRADGSRFWAEIATTHLVEDDGCRSKGYVQIVHDLSERRRVEALESEGRRIADFIAMLSHELRNPLAPIRNATGVLRRVVDDPEAVWCLDLIGRQTEHLARLVDDLLDVSRVTSGKIRLELAALEFNTLVRLAVDSVKATVKGHDHTLTMRLAPQPLPLRADGTRLTQVVVNLLNNAAKYTPAGGHLTVSVESRAESAVLQVADTGIGLNEALLQHAFDPFVQGARALDRSDGGLGIGLTLVKSIVELHGGTVTAASPGVGRGATFTVMLPLSRAEERLTQSLAESAVAAARKVLVVDDNADSADSLAAVLRLSGHEVQVAGDGQRALELAASMRPDTVLLDIGLPHMDGYEVARRLRALPGLAEVQLIALTGYAQDADRRAASDAGFEQHLTKPVDLDELARIIAG